MNRFEFIYKEKLRKYPVTFVETVFLVVNVVDWCLLYITLIKFTQKYTGFMIILHKVYIFTRKLNCELDILIENLISVIIFCIYRSILHNHNAVHSGGIYIWKYPQFIWDSFVISDATVSVCIFNVPQFHRQNVH